MDLAEYGRGLNVDLILGAEARGFILGAAVAYALGVGFAAARKPGKLPYAVNRCEYDLEYGTDVLEMHTDAIKPGQRVLFTMTCWRPVGQPQRRSKLVEEAGGVVAGLAFVIELTELGGRDRLAGYEVFSLIQYDV